MKNKIMLWPENIIESTWETAKNQFKIQQIKEEWLWLINNTVNKWDKRGNILEIGAYDGGSSYFLSNFANKMTTIDNNDPCRFDHSKFNCDYIYVAGDSHTPNQISHFNRKEWDHEDKEEFEWDFAFIDGDHSYEGVKADFYNLLPHLKKGTPVAFHDIAISDFHHTHGCYVGEFWRDLKKEYSATKFDEFQTDVAWAGIGVVWI
jgi:predicted O-methyltransferase YrrM